MEASTEELPIEQTAFNAGAFKLQRYTVRPIAPPSAVLCILHGYGDHANRYAHVLRWFAASGILCHTFDFRGHGRSGGRKAYVNRWEDYLDDLTAFLQTPDLIPSGTTPLFILGHSHGGLVAAAAGIAGLLNGVAGVILSAPYFALKMPVSKPRLILGRLLGFVLPSFEIRSGVGGQMLSSDEQMLADTRADPFCYGIATPRWFSTCTKVQSNILRQADEFKLPLLTLIGEDDPLADPVAMKEFHQRAGADDKMLQVYPGLLHELLRERQRERVFIDIFNWIQRKLKSSASDVNTLPKN